MQKFDFVGRIHEQLILYFGFGLYAIFSNDHKTNNFLLQINSLSVVHSIFDSSKKIISKQQFLATTLE